MRWVNLTGKAQVWTAPAKEEHFFLHPLKVIKGSGTNCESPAANVEAA